LRFTTFSGVTAMPYTLRSKQDIKESWHQIVGGGESEMHQFCNMAPFVAENRSDLK
jgi:hypothetical protein